MGNAARDENRITTLLGVSSADGVTPVTIYADPTTHRLLVDNASSGGITIGTTTITGGTDKGILYDDNGVVGEYTPSASLILATDASKNVQGLTTATYPSLTELSYVKGVTSAIQTQIDAKGSGTVTSVSVASANGFAGSSSGGATPALTLSTTITGTLQGNGTAISASKVTLTQPATGSTLTILDGKTLTVDKTMEFTAADDTGVYTFPTGTKTLLANDLSNIGTAVANLIFTDNTYDIGASGATRPRTVYVATSVVSPVVNATTGVQINGGATSNTILKGNGTNYVASSYTLADPGTSGNVLTSNGTNWTSVAPSSSFTGWKLISTGSFSSSTQDYSVTSLDGSTDKFYMLVFWVTNNTNTFTPSITVNSNTGGAWEYSLPSIQTGTTWANGATNNAARLNASGINSRGHMVTAYIAGTSFSFDGNYALLAHGTSTSLGTDSTTQAAYVSQFGGMLRLGTQDSVSTINIRLSNASGTYSGTYTLYAQG